MAEIKVVWTGRYNFDDEGGEKTDFSSVEEAVAYCQKKVDKCFNGQPDLILRTLSAKKKKNKSAVKNALLDSYRTFGTSWTVVVDGKIHWTDEGYARTKCDSVMAQFSSPAKPKHGVME